MKKFSLTLMLLLLIGIACCKVQITQWVYPEKAINKNIELVIPVENSYRNKIYARSVAKLNITVIKLKAQGTDTLLVKNYPEFKLRNLSFYAKQFSQRLYIPYLVDSKEQIIVRYNVTYKNSKEEVLTIQNVKWVPKGVMENKVLITI